MNARAGATKSRKTRKTILLQERDRKRSLVPEDEILGNHVCVMSASTRRSASVTATRVKMRNVATGCPVEFNATISILI